MKKFLIALNLVIWSLVTYEVAHAEVKKAPPTASKPAKKEVKHHKKAEGTTMAGTKPDTAPVKKATKKK
jgi:hypothetical protein